MKLAPVLNATTDLLGAMPSWLVTRILLRAVVSDATLEVAISVHKYIGKVDRPVTVDELHKNVAGEPRLFLAIVALGCSEIVQWVRDDKGEPTGVELTEKGKRKLQRIHGADLANMREVHAVLCQGENKQAVRAFRCEHDVWRLEWSIFSDGSFSAWTVAPIGGDTYVIIGYLLGLVASNLSSSMQAQRGKRVILGHVRMPAGVSLLEPTPASERHVS